MIFTLAPRLRCAVQPSCKSYVVKRHKKRVTELLLAHYDAAELIFVALLQQRRSGYWLRSDTCHGHFRSSSFVLLRVCSRYSRLMVGAGVVEVALPTDLLNNRPFTHWDAARHALLLCSGPAILVPITKTTTQKDNRIFNLIVGHNPINT